MKSLRNSSKFVLASLMALCTTPLTASPETEAVEPGQVQEWNMPNVLIVRTMESQGVASKSHSQGQTPETGGGQPMEQQSAQVVPLRLNLPRNAQGSVNIQQLVQDAEQASTQGEVVQLQAIDQSQMSQIPSQVQTAFQRYTQGSEIEIFPWLWFHRPVGGNYGYAWPNYGYYGYGYAPYYVYNYGAFPSYYQPHFGVYSGGGLYPFTYGSYRRHGGWVYNYYYRP